MSLASYKIKILVYSWHVFLKKSVLYCLFYFIYFNRVHFNINMDLSIHKVKSLAWIQTWQHFSSNNNPGAFFIMILMIYNFSIQGSLSQMSIKKNLLFVNLKGCIMFVLSVLFWHCPFSTSASLANRSQWSVGPLLQSISLHVLQETVLSHCKQSANGRVFNSSSRSLFLVRHSRGSEFLTPVWVRIPSPFLILSGKIVMFFVCCFVWVPMRKAWHWMLFS